MSVNLVKHELYLARKTALAWALTIGSFAAMFAGFTNLIIGNEGIAGLMKAYPKALLDAFNFNLASLTSFEGWMSTEPFTFFALLLGIFAALAAATAVSREVDQRTGEFLFTTPESRTSIFMSKVAAGLLLITGMWLVGILVTVGVGATIVEIHNLRGLIALYVAPYFAALALAGVGYVLTSVVDTERTVMAIGAGIATLSFLLNSLSGLDKRVSWIADLSVFHAFDPAKLLRTGSLPLAATLVMLGIYVVGILLGSKLLARRNLSM